MVFPQNKKILLIFAVDSPLNLSKKKKKIENLDELAPAKVGVGEMAGHMGRCVTLRSL